MYPINNASPLRIAVGAVVQISDGAVQTSGVSISILAQGQSTAAGGGTTAYENGIVVYTPTQAETNYTAFIVVAYKTGCIPAAVTVVTSASSTAGYAGTDQSKIANPTSTVNLSGTTVKAVTDNVNAQLANGVTHGGSTAKLQLGSSNATPALDIQSSGGNAVEMLSTGGNGVGLLCQGEGGGAGLYAGGGATGHGILAEGGLTSGDGIHAAAQTLGDGMDLVGAGGGVDLRADITGNITGSVESIATDGITADSLSTAAANKLTDIAARRSQTNIAASAYGEMATGRNQLRMMRQQNNRLSTDANPGYLTGYAEDDTTEVFQKALTTSSSAQPIVNADPT